LDADTIVKKDLSPLLHGSFDFSAREQFPPMCHSRNFNMKIWLSIFQQLGKDPIPVPNAGFMIFKNFLHRRIKYEWLKLTNDECLANPCTYSNLKEQSALALAVSGNGIKWMTSKEHAYRWLNEQRAETYVLHGVPRYLNSFFLAEQRLLDAAESTLFHLIQLPTRLTRRISP